MINVGHCRRVYRHPTRALLVRKKEELQGATAMEAHSQSPLRIAQTCVPRPAPGTGCRGNYSHQQWRRLATHRQRAPAPDRPGRRPPELVPLRRPAPRDARLGPTGEPPHPWRDLPDDPQPSCSIDDAPSRYAGLCKAALEQRFIAIHERGECADGSRIHGIGPVSQPIQAFEGGYMRAQVDAGASQVLP